ncbi:MAG: MarR family winged helix-turn-helix transcriptional regulator [Verrucomicrobiota bacterium]
MIKAPKASTKKGIPTTELKVEVQFCAELQKLNRAITLYFDRMMNRADLTSGQFIILNLLELNSQASPSQLSQMTGIELSAMTRALVLLQMYGAVKLAPNPKGRGKIAQLTAEGKKQLQLARPIWVKAETILEEKLNEIELRDFVEKIERVNQALNE